MAIAPLGASESGVSSRTKLNSAIDRANEVETARGGEATLSARLASISDDAAEAAGDAAAAAVQGVADNINIHRGSPSGRPGATPTEYFETNNIGATLPPTGGLTNISGARLVTSDYGEVVRIQNAAIVVATRWPFRNVAGQLAEITYAVQREVDPANPATSMVTLAARYLNKDYADLGGAPTIGVINNLTVASGRVERTFIVGIDFIPPAGTVYIRPYVVATGTDHTTLVEMIRSRDITNTEGLSERVINAKSGRLLLDGDSLSGVYYTLPGKAWINRVSSLTDWQLANISLTSDDALESWSRFVGGATIYGPLAGRDLDPSHVLIMLFANDSNVRDSRTRLFVENLRRKIKAARSAGINPVVVTEGRKARGIEQAAMSYLAWEEGAPIWEITGEYFCQDATRNVDYHYSNHPGTRHTNHYADAVMRHAGKLGRPATSFKAFRPRYQRQLFAPVYSWTFNGGTTRCWPNAANNGTLVGTAAIVTDSQRGYCYEAVASGDRMTFGGAPAMPATYTFAAWVKPSSTGSSRNILSGITAGRLNIMLESGRLWIRHGSGGADIDVAAGVTVGEWMHVAVTYDAVRDLLTAFVNGAQVASMTGAGAHNCTDPQLGASGTGSSLIGRIDDAHIWDKPLDAWQVATVAQHRDGLTYDGREMRHVLWKELEVGHYALTEPKRPYYDALQATAPAYASQDSEYQTLQQGGAVSFVDKALLQFVVPGSAANTRGLRLRMKGASGATLYWLSRRPVAPAGGGAYNKSRGFLTATYPVGTTAGDVYSFSGQDYIVNGVTRNKDGAGWIVWANPEVSTADVAGTLTRVSGGGPNSIVFTATLNFADAAYYNEIDRPYVRWLEGSSIAADLRDGQASVRATNVIKQVIDYDVVTVLVEKKGAFSLSDIELRWIGVAEKDRTERGEAMHRPGTALPMDTTFDGLSGSDWVAIGAAAEADPADGVLPYGVTKVVNVNKTDMVRQPVTIDADPLLRKRIQIRVGCRFAPPKFGPSSGSPVDVQEYYEIAPITEHTPDVARLVVSLDNGNSKYAVVAKKMIGLAPTDAVIDIDIPNALVWETSACRLTLSAEGMFGEDASIQLYRAEIIDCGAIEPN